jgi:hypothetical protein
VRKQEDKGIKKINQEAKELHQEYNILAILFKKSS